MGSAALKWVLIGLVLILGVSTGSMYALYSTEAKKNRRLREENLKTQEEARLEIKKLKEDSDRAQAKDLEERQKLVDQVALFSRERERAQQEVDAIKRKILNEKELSLAANEDLVKLREAIAALRQQSKEDMMTLEESFQQNLKNYQNRTSVLEEELAQASDRLTRSSERYHYNLGVVYTQNKEFEAALKEYHTALKFNPNSAPAHYNLGIIYEDYYQDVAKAREHYQKYLELNPQSEDAAAVREWLSALDQSIVS